MGTSTAKPVEQVANAGNLDPIAERPIIDLLPITSFLLALHIMSPILMMLQTIVIDQILCIHLRITH